MEVHTLVQAIDVLRNRRGSSGFRCRIVGDGPSCAAVRALAEQANLQDCVEFTGYLAGKELLASLSTFDIGVIPDPKDCYTDHITMNKAFEYMFLGKPVVGFRLRETERIVGDCGILPKRRRPRRSPMPSPDCWTTPLCAESWERPRASAQAKNSRGQRTRKSWWVPTRIYCGRVPLSGIGRLAAFCVGVRDNRLLPPKGGENPPDRPTQGHSLDFGRLAATSRFQRTPSVADSAATIRQAR